MASQCCACFRHHEEPQTLPCGHLVCKSCSERLSTLFDSNGDADLVTCPACHEECDRSALAPLKDELSGKGQNKQTTRNSKGGATSKPIQMCPNCEKNAAELECAECGPMCPKCSAQIHSVRTFSFSLSLSLYISLSLSLSLVCGVLLLIAVNLFSRTSHKHTHFKL
jgi:hypothetical protein